MSRVISPAVREGLTRKDSSKEVGSKIKLICMTR